MKYKKSTKKFDVWNPNPKACLYFIVIAFTLVIRLFILWFMRFLFLTLQVSDNNLFYLEAIHNFVEVSHDEYRIYLAFWPWRIKYYLTNKIYQSLPSIILMNFRTFWNTNRSCDVKKSSLFTNSRHKCTFTSMDLPGYYILDCYFNKNEGNL